jgi:hypothetical protein
MIKDIVVVGGGFAGYITALMLDDVVRKWWKDTTITIIESSKLGTIGVGESTAQNIPNILASLNINPYEFMQEAKATFKISARFDNWNYEGESYHHPLMSVSHLLELKIKSDKRNKPNVIDPYSIIYLDMLYLLAKDIPCENVGFNELAYENKLPFKYLGNEEYELIKIGDDDKTLIPKSGLDTILGFHMDANLSAKFLQGKCKERNITVIDGKVVDWQLDSETGNLKELGLEDGTKIEGDFFFDCTGLRRLLLGEIFKEEFIDYSKWIPQNSVSIIKDGVKYKEDEDPKNYTILDAQKHGWMFKIPLYNRMGSGYVYSNKFVDADTIKKEQIEHWKKQGYDVEVDRQFSWTPGKFKRSWVKNCIAVGLSEGFVEPLDGNALILSMSLFKEFLPRYHRHMLFDGSDVDEFNNLALDAYDHTKNYVYFCHLAKRNDSDYWKYFKEDDNMPDWIREKIWLWEHRSLRGYEKLTDQLNPFGIGSWTTIGQRSGYIGAHTAARDLEVYKVEPEAEQVFNMSKNAKKEVLKHSSPHNDVLKWINNMNFKGEVK